MEVLTVLILLGVMAASVLGIKPSSNADVSAEADRLRSHLRYVQLRAQADIYDWRLVFINSRDYRLGPVVITGRGFTPSAIPGTTQKRGTLGNGLRTNSGTVIRFDSWGRPLTDFGSLLTTDQTITLTGGGESRTITIRAGTGLIE